MLEGVLLEVEILTPDLPQQLGDFVEAAADIVRERGEFGPGAVPVAGSALWEAGEQIRGELGIASANGGETPFTRPMSDAMMSNVAFAREMRAVRHQGYTKDDEERRRLREAAAKRAAITGDDAA